LGAGKTTLSRSILTGLGLSPDIPVTSPTYTYMNEYLIQGCWYAHLDLYRVKPGMTAEDLGLADAKPYRGILVEWPDMLPDDPFITPTHRLTIDFTTGEEDERTCLLKGTQNP
jgi:tRNA threonylcarbamoyl adenosine modification protein YjeE